MTSPPARALIAPWWRPGLAVLLGLLALAATSDVAGPAVRVLALLLFLVFGPGLALVGLLDMDEPWREAALVIGVSLAVDLVFLTALAYNGGRSAGDGLAVLLGVTVLGAAAQVVLPAVRRRREGRAE
jgi:hypothetical protein